MAVLLQGFYKKTLQPGNVVAVPSPTDASSSVRWWWDQLAVEAQSFREAGFTAIWLPPVLKTGAGSGPTADGYGPFDDYDIGSRQQKGGLPTRFGTREQLQRCVAVLRANGLNVYVDLVEHHRSGDSTPPFVFSYPGATGLAGQGRFPKNPGNFVPQVPRDPNLGGPVADDAPFGRELAPINGHVAGDLTDAADWLTRALDIQGYRLDDVKGLSTDFLVPFLNAKSMARKFAVGEFFDGNPDLVSGWVFNPRGMNGRALAFDFPLKFILNAMCNNPNGFNMATLDHAGFAGASPDHAVTFVENHDTDNNPGQAIVQNKALAYAYILTSEGLPSVYYRDYTTDPDGYGLKPQIDNLIWIRENIAQGATQQRWMDFDVFAYERLGAPNLLVALNKDPANSRTITVQTNFGAGVALHDYTGHSATLTNRGSDVFQTDANGNVTVTIPSNANGLGYVCLSRSGINAGALPASHPVTQDFDGAMDLDIPAAQAGQTIQAARVWCAAGTNLTANLMVDRTGWKAATSIMCSVLGPDGVTVGNATITAAVQPSVQVAVTVEGYFTLTLLTSNTPAANPNPTFTLRLSYQAPADPDIDRLDPEEAHPLAPANIGVWSPVIDLPNVPIHSHLLPSEKLLFWGRRQPAGSLDFPSLNQHSTTAYVWDPTRPGDEAQPTNNQPADANLISLNLFCSGHTFMPDGRLLVAGGHLFDSEGLNTSVIFDWRTNSWSPGPSMSNGPQDGQFNFGRWYPSCVILPSGDVFVLGGSYTDTQADLQPPLQNTNNRILQNQTPQIMNGGAWHNRSGAPSGLLFPRMHVTSRGNIFLSGPPANAALFTNFEDLSPGAATGTWQPPIPRSTGNVEYAPAIRLADGRIAFIGGGGGDNSTPPTADVPVIDPDAAGAIWQNATAMPQGRRQHNGTLLPDGTVLVTGGSTGPGFNDLGPKAIHQALLWDPAANTWTVMAAEEVDRCYHSTAVLLPDGRVFSGGGGEYAPQDNLPACNPPEDSHANCQIFSPPYLFKGSRPDLSAAPTGAIHYGDSFLVQSTTAAEVTSASLLGLSSVTHSCNMNQRILFLDVAAGNNPNEIKVTAPANANLAPPGFYMLFLLDNRKVPSTAKMVQIAPSAPANLAPAAPVQALAPQGLIPQNLPLRTFAQGVRAVSGSVRQTEMLNQHGKPPVTIGLSTGCPYGLSACWAGAYTALPQLTGVGDVLPMPDANRRLGFVFLNHNGLPAVDQWPAQFENQVKGSHSFRGVEVTLTGIVRRNANGLDLLATEQRQQVHLEAITRGDKLQWDPSARGPESLTAEEAEAFAALEAAVEKGGGSTECTVTGPLTKPNGSYLLKVRLLRGEAKSLYAIDSPPSTSGTPASCCGAVS